MWIEDHPLFVVVGPQYLRWLFLVVLGVRIPCIYNHISYSYDTYHSGYRRLHKTAMGQDKMIWPATYLLLRLMCCSSQSISGALLTLRNKRNITFSDLHHSHEIWSDCTPLHHNQILLDLPSVAPIISLFNSLEFDWSSSPTPQQVYLFLYKCILVWGSLGRFEASHCMMPGELSETDVKRGRKFSRIQNVQHLDF